MLLLIGVPLFTPSTRFLANSKNICSFSVDTFASRIIERINGSTPTITPMPMTKKKNLSPAKKDTAMIINDAMIPVMCTFFISILYVRLFYLQKHQKTDVYSNNSQNHDKSYGPRA